MTDTFDTTRANRVAFFSSKGDGRDRWTELELWFDADRPGQKKWLAVSRGCSDRAGEVDKLRELEAGTMSRALTMFDPNTTAGRAMHAEALDWLDANRALVERPPAYQPLVMDDQAALARLFGDGATLKAQADALGLGESTLRMQLKEGKDVRVALRALLPFVDIEAFRRAKGLGA